MTKDHGQRVMNLKIKFDKKESMDSFLIEFYLQINDLYQWL